MALVSTVTANEMQRDMAAAGRDNFSFRALDLIIEYYEEYGENVEFYPIDIDCTFTEFDLSVEEEREQFISDYGYLVDDEFSDEDSLLEAIQEELEQNTLVLCNTYDLVLFDYNF